MGILGIGYNFATGQRAGTGFIKKSVSFLYYLSLFRRVSDVKITYFKERGIIILK